LPKKKIEKPQREVTKRQLSHWQRESRMQRIIMTAGAVVVVAILAIVGTGIYMNKYKPYQETIVKVDGKSYSMDYYIDSLAYMGMANGSPQLIQYFTDYAVQFIEQNYFYLKEAAKQLGITISDQEVKAEMEKNNLGNNQARADFVKAQLLDKKLTDYFSQNQVPTSAQQKQAKAMFLESVTQANEVVERINNGEAFGDIAAQLSLESVTKEKRGDFGWLPQGVLPDVLNDQANKVLEDKIFSADMPADTLTTVADPDRSKDMGYWLIKISEAPAEPEVTPPPGAPPTETPEKSWNVMVMLLNSKEVAEKVKADLAAGGEGKDFITLAKANSQYANATENGGDLGTLTKTEITDKFNDTLAGAIFNEDGSLKIQLDQVSDPIADSEQNTKGGVWLIEASSLEEQPISEEYRSIMTGNKVNDWKNEIWTANSSNVELLLTEEQKTFAVAEAQLR